MALPGFIKAGEIFWVDALPPLDGQKPERHPAVVIEIIDSIEVLVVGVSTDRSDPDRVDIPNCTDEPGAETTLDEKCCALPRWTVSIDPARLKKHEWCGTLPEITLARLDHAVERALDEWEGSCGDLLEGGDSPDTPKG